MLRERSWTKPWEGETGNQSGGWGWGSRRRVWGLVEGQGIEGVKATEGLT